MIVRINPNTLKTFNTSDDMGPNQSEHCWSLQRSGKYQQNMGPAYTRASCGASWGHPAHHRGWEWLKEVLVFLLTYHRTPLGKEETKMKTA